MPFNHQYTEQGKQQKELSGRKARTMVALENNVDPADLRTNSKQHFKAPRKKTRAMRAADDD
jgi:large subunit GTPase 1